MEMNLLQYTLGSARLGIFSFRIATRRRLTFVLLELALIYPAWAEASSTNHAFPGIAIYSESRPQPPTRLFVAEINLTNPKVRLRVSPGGPDPTGPGEWQTTLMPPTRIAARENMDLVVNGDFFRAREVKDAEVPTRLSALRIGARSAGLPSPTARPGPPATLAVRAWW